MTEKPTDPTKDPNEETILAVQAKLEAAIAARTRASEEDTQRSEAEPPHLQRLIEAAEGLIEQIDDAEACRTGANQHLVLAAEKRLREALQPYRSGK